jgi:hypothetical protein
VTTFAFCIFDISDPCAVELLHLFNTLKESADVAEALITENPENAYRIMKIVDVEASDWSDGSGVDVS